MKRLLLFIFGTVLFISCSKEVCRLEPKKDCKCTNEYDPVCGCDRITYANPCEADCNGIQNYRRGECTNNTMPMYPGGY